MVLPAKEDGRRNNGGQNKWVPTELDLHQLEEFAFLSLPLSYIATLFGITEATLHRAIKRDKRIAYSLNVGRAKGASCLHAKMYKMAMNRKIRQTIAHDKKGNPIVAEVAEYSGDVEFKAVQFLLKAREGWSDSWASPQEIQKVIDELERLRTMLAKKDSGTDVPRGRGQPGKQRDSK